MKALVIVWASIFFGSLAARASEPPRTSQFVRHLATVQNPSTDFETFVGQLHEAGMRIEGELEAPSFEAVVPRGRSLQKHAVRHLKALVYRKGSTFVGYAPKTDRGEVISWNGEAGRYEFIQFSGLKAKSLIVKPANRAFCTSCHQGGLPIFPRAPWSEMFADDVFKTYRVTDKDLDKLSVSEREKKRFINVAFFDKAVRLAKLGVQRDLTCREMCGGNVECRSQLLLAALTFHDPKARRAEMDRLFDVIFKAQDLPIDERINEAGKRNLAALAKAVEPLWPTDGYALPSTTLLDRNPSSKTPAGFKLVGRLRNGEDPNFSEGFSHVAIARSPLSGDPIRDDILNYQRAEFSADDLKEEKLTRSELALLEPKNHRPMTGAIPKRLAARWARAVALDCFPSLDSEDVSAERAEAAVKSPKVLAALCEWPTDGERALAAVKEALEERNGAVRSEAGEPFACANVASRPSDAIKPVALLEEAIAPTSSRGLGIANGAFTKYCSECHGPGSEIPFKLDDLEFLKSYRGVYEHSVQRSLETKAMPPKTATLQPSRKERQAMIRALSN